LPIGEGEFVTYDNVTRGGGGTWDWSNFEERKLETQLTFQLLLDNVPYTPPAGKEVLLELEFCH
jgi:hypothetical protein